MAKRPTDRGQDRRQEVELSRKKSMEMGRRNSNGGPMGRRSSTNGTRYPLPLKFDEKTLSMDRVFDALNRRKSTAEAADVMDQVSEVARSQGASPVPGHPSASSNARPSYLERPGTAMMGRTSTGRQKVSRLDDRTPQSARNFIFPPGPQPPHDASSPTSGRNSPVSPPREAWGAAEPGARRQPNRALSARSGASTPDPFRGPHDYNWLGERMSCATMQAVWTACDVFWAFDTKHSGYIDRKVYIHKLKDPPSVERLRVLRRANLSRRFAENASPLSLEEMLQIMWPSAGAEDRATMHRWVQLREVWHIFHHPDFRGTDLDRERAFKLLNAKSERDGICASEVTRAQLFTWDEACRVARVHDRQLRRYKIDQLEWRERWWPQLKAAFVSPQTLAKLKKEEETSVSNDFSYTLRAGLSTAAVF